MSGKSRFNYSCGISEDISTNGNFWKTTLSGIFRILEYTSVNKSLYEKPYEISARECTIFAFISVTR